MQGTCLSDGALLFSRTLQAACTKTCLVLSPFLHPPVQPCTVPCPGPLHLAPCTRAPSPCTGPRAPLSLAAPVPCTFPCTPVHRYRALPRPFLHLCTRTPSPCTVIAPRPVHRYRALPRSPPCPSAYTRAPSPCTVIARCPGPLHLPVHARAPLSPRSSPVHPPRAPLSRSAPAPSRPPRTPVHLLLCSRAPPCPGPNPVELHNLTG